MTNYREILRLHSLGLNKTEIAASLHCARKRKRPSMRTLPLWEMSVAYSWNTMFTRRATAC